MVWGQTSCSTWGGYLRNLPTQQILLFLTFICDQYLNEIHITFKVIFYYQNWKSFCPNRCMISESNQMSRTLNATLHPSMGLRTGVQGCASGEHARTCYICCQYQILPPGRKTNWHFQKVEKSAKWYHLVSQVYP